jgi:hypothetical protein
MKVAAALAAALISARYCAAAYPAEYPFDNESVVPPAPLEATPSWTFDTSDNGGYIYTYGYAFATTSDETEDGFCYGKNGFWSHYFVVHSGGTPLTSDAEFNCTAKNFVIGDFSHYGIINDNKICEEGECCKDWYGTLSYWPSDSPYMPYYEEVSKSEADGGCDEPFGEQVYCVFMNNGQQWGCNEQYVTSTERSVTNPCADSFYNHYMGCALYKISGFLWRPKIEPEEYVAALSPAETNALNAFYFVPDRVCHPYSYYYPETAKSSSASDSSMDSESASESASESESSGTHVAIASLAVLFAL